MCFIVFSPCEEAINFSTGFCRLFVGFLLNAKVVRWFIKVASLVVKSWGTPYRYFLVLGS